MEVCFEWVFWGGVGSTREGDVGERERESIRSEGTVWSDALRSFLGC